MISYEYSWLTVVLAATPASLLLISGAHHLKGLDRFKRAISAHGIVPDRFALIMAVCVTIVELAIPVLVSLALAEMGTAYPYLLMSLLYVSFAVYASIVPSDELVPCGCGDHRELLEGSTVVRAGLLAAMAGGAATIVLMVPALGVPLENLNVEAVIFAILVVSALASLTWLLPSALATGKLMRLESQETNS